jgi:hypothetical protein
VRLRLASSLLAVVLSVAGLGAAPVQSTAASVSGTVFDEEHGSVAGATVTLTNDGTGQRAIRTTDAGGRFWILGVTPGRYRLAIERDGFAPNVRDLTISIGDKAEIISTLRLVKIATTVTVQAKASSIGSSDTTPGRTMTLDQIEGLPIAQRDFTNLALLAPGIFVNRSSNLASSTGIASAGQTGRNNTFLMDGLTLDDSQSAARGSASLDAVAEFVVLSSGFSAEYGQASGAVVSAITRSGTNTPAGRGWYFLRDDRLDATPFAARFANPPLVTSPFEQHTVGGFLGGPIRRDRTFFFSSVEHVQVNSEAIITSPVLHLPGYRPDAPTHVPSPLGNLKVLGRTDIGVTPSNRLTLRYRMDRSAQTNRFGAVDVNVAAPERGFDALDRNQDVALIDTHAWRATALNELRLQFAERHFVFSATDPTRSCPNCPAEQRTSIKLGKNPAVPSDVVEDRWQAFETLTRHAGGGTGDHLVKAGVDVSLIGRTSRGVANADGTFLFPDTPFVVTDVTTYPTQYTQASSGPNARVDHVLAAVFVQDHWRANRDLTIDAGVRWDHDSAPGIARDMSDVAPRLGLAVHPRGWQTTTVRAGIGRYYDQVPLSIAGDVGIQTLSITNPGYPDPYGRNDRRTTAAAAPVTDIRVPSDGMRMPFTDQARIGVQQAIDRTWDVTADLVWARGRHLLLTEDTNYPDLTDPARRRPDSPFQKELAVVAKGHSWYRGLQMGVDKRDPRRYSCAFQYTWSTSERDTEDFGFMAQDQRDLAAERGPSLSDARHRLSASGDVRLPWRLRFASVIAASSALPYNQVTLKDGNEDGDMTTDRPSGVSRNASRGSPFWQWDVRFSKELSARRCRIEFVADAFNVTNHRNVVTYVNKEGATFGTPATWDLARQVQLGVRVTF